MTRLIARGLSCGYRERLVLEDVNLVVEPGELLALVGPKGAGKTTLFRALAGELPARAGEALIEVDGLAYEAGKLHRRDRARRIARVLQGERPAWAAPVRDYVAAGLFAGLGWFGLAGRTEEEGVEAGE